MASQEVWLPFFKKMVVDVLSTTRWRCPVELFTVREMNKVVLECFKKGGSEVLYEVGNEAYTRPFVYQVFRARSREGVLHVRTCDGWKIPHRVFIRSTVEK